MVVVTVEKAEEVLDKCTAFKTTNTTLGPEKCKAFLHLYLKIYGKLEVMNNEFMA